MKKRKLTPEEIAYSEERLARLRARERALREASEARKRAQQAPKPSWRRRLGFR